MKRASLPLLLSPLLLLLAIALSSCAKETSIKELSASLEELIADANGNPTDTTIKSLQVVISSPEEWQVNSDASWLSTNSQMGGISRTVVGIKVTPNLTGKERTGQLTFSTSNQSVAVKVKQLGGDTNIETVLYEIPVIFHVLYNEADKNNTDTLRRKYVLNSADAQVILEYINQLFGQQPRQVGNEIYRGIKRKYQQGQQEVYHLPLETKIRFKLANEKPDGTRQSPAGINAIAMDERSLDPKVVMSDKAGGRYHDMAWPIKQYINIYVFPFTRHQERADQVVMGISHMPLALSSAPIEGLKQLGSQEEQYIKEHGGLDQFSNYNHCITLNSDGFEWRTWKETFLKADLGKNTLAHELGHYLGLYHTFSEVVGSDGNLVLDSCDDTDYCADTQSYNRKQYEESRADIIASGTTSLVQIIGLLMRNDCQSGRFEATNIMDYDFCHSDEWTPNQVSRMRQVLYNTYTTPGIKVASPRSLLKGYSPDQRVMVEGTPVAIPCRTQLIR